MTELLKTYSLLCLAALLAGIMNSLAGGGTLLTFPALLSVLPPGSSVVANVTSTVAVVPGSLAGAWGYRREMSEDWRWMRLLIWPSFAGGLLGSLMLITLGEGLFKQVVPWLVLTAALLFLVQPLLARWTGVGVPHRPPSPAARVGLLFFQFLVAVYGGYFGAGIGILMLSALGLMGLSNIHHMNALKTLLAFVINGISVIVFVVDGQVRWSYALSMAVAAILGGYLGAHYGRRFNRTLVRWLVVVIGFVLTGYFFYEQALST
jgi:uncharacterized membrane protein YfcA